MFALWAAVFGNDHPVEVDVGSGTGTFILPAAAAHPQTNFLGLERSRGRAFHLQARVKARALGNARVLCGDAACVVTSILPAQSVAAYHIYFPDPWWKRRHHHRRLFTPAFVAGVARTLAPGGRLYTATDVDEVFDRIRNIVADAAGLIPDPQTRSPRPAITAFERKGVARGAIIREATFLKSEASPRYTSNAAPITPAASPS